MREEIQVCFTNYCLQFFFLFLILQLILSVCQVTKSLFETASNLQYFFTSVKEFVFSSMVRLFVSKF